MTEAPRPTLLQRLRDGNPGSEREDQPAFLEPAELEESVRRDLERLLNTRQRGVLIRDENGNVIRSLWNYGVPDISTISFATPGDRRRVCQQLEKAIRLFEPRFSEVFVELPEPFEPTSRSIRFQIDAVLRSELAGALRFQSTLEPVTSKFKVKSVDG